MFRLKELRIENGLKRSEFARAIKLPATTVANYENETRQASYETLIAFAKFFNVSVDYLLGNSDDFALSVKMGNNSSVLTLEEKELLKEYRNCTELGKDRILETAKLWSVAGTLRDDI